MPDWRVFHVHLNDEIPRVGSGERHVEADVGKKWVYVRRHTNYAGKGGLRKSRLTVAHWNALNPVLMENMHAAHPDVE